MSVRPDPNFIPVQDAAPKSGFIKTALEQTSGARGPKGWQLFLGAGVVIFYGFSRLGASNKKRSEQELFERQQRYALVPLLQNEADRVYLMRRKKILEREAQIMRDVPGWQVGASTYYGSRWTPSHVVDGDKNIQKK
eukprot:CAMPEP_0119548586 /NCGR_PEP_ID=MMETSP1352-20130426/2471_1 /TAXON_ID=265584 /ORGANISM="Stauroneis constricta, Strain CCMP1120" /LENGTH=136 /DNA_ID=CAMNT_0007593895 /DNA_START=84 /DNA_END=494 /DNA_ORIENTATION=-